MTVPAMLRRTVLIAIALTALMAVPAIASADTLTVTPCNSGCSPNNSSFAAGGASSFTVTADATGSPSPGSNLVLSFVPGLLVNLNADPTCLTFAGAAHPAECLIGHAAGGPATFDSYLVQAPNTNDVAGIDLVCTSGPPPCPGFVEHGELSLHQITSGTGAGQVQGDLALPGMYAGTFTFSFNGNIGNGHAFVRMPTNCSPAVGSSMTITYGALPTTTAANPDVKDDSNFQSTCHALQYSPQLTAQAQKDNADNGVAVQTTISQGPGQAASLNSTLASSQALGPNANALSLQNSGTPVGTASIQSPLQPGTVSGQVFLTGTPVAPTLTVQFAAPYNVSLVGAIKLANNSLVYSTAAGGLDLPDIPLSSLTVSLFGGPKALFTTSCAPSTATINGSFTAQNAKTATSNATFAIGNCSSTPTVGKPTVANKSLSGLGKGKPHLSFKLKSGSGAAKLKKIVVKPGRGLQFLKKVKNGKGLKVSGGKVKSVTVKGGRLVITLKSAVAGVSVKLSPPALQESPALKKKAKKKKVKSLTVKLNVTDANNLTTQLPLTFNKPK